MSSFESLARMARLHAMEAMHRGNPEYARKWIEAAAAAEAAIRGEYLLPFPNPEEEE